MGSSSGYKNMREPDSKCTCLSEMTHLSWRRHIDQLRPHYEVNEDTNPGETPIIRSDKSIFPSMTQRKLVSQIQFLWSLVLLQNETTKNLLQQKTIMGRLQTHVVQQVFDKDKSTTPRLTISWCIMV